MRQANQMGFLRSNNGQLQFLVGWERNMHNKLRIKPPGKMNGRIRKTKTSTTAYLPLDYESREGEYESDGISVCWFHQKKLLSIDGWYDGMVGIRGDTMTLRKFCDALGITEQDCMDAWKK